MLAQFYSELFVNINIFLNENRTQNNYLEPIYGHYSTFSLNFTLYSTWITAYGDILESRHSASRPNPRRDFLCYSNQKLFDIQHVMFQKVNVAWKTEFSNTRLPTYLTISGIQRKDAFFPFFFQTKKILKPWLSQYYAKTKLIVNNIGYVSLAPQSPSTRSIVDTTSRHGT